jgi:hypothetical protein
MSTVVFTLDILAARAERCQPYLSIWVTRIVATGEAPNGRLPAGWWVWQGASAVGPGDQMRVRPAQPAAVPGGSRRTALVASLLIGVSLAGGGCSYEPVMLPVAALGDAGGGRSEPPGGAFDAAGAGGEGPDRTELDRDARSGAPATTADGAPATEPAPADAAPVGQLDGGGRDARAAPPPDAAAPAPRDAPALPSPDGPPSRPPDAAPACVVAPEVCDGRDNDCDGTADDGFRVSSHRTSYTELQRHDAGCTAAVRFGVACNRAAHRFCVARGCASTGFAPIENSGDVAVVACVAGAALRNVTAAALTSLQVACVPGSPHSLGCNSAIHRYCLGQGFASGFGPVEVNATSSLVACVGGAHVSLVSTTYAVLRGLHQGCTGDTERLGLTCNAAIDRFCAARNALTGFGPAENSGERADVVCIAP